LSRFIQAERRQDRNKAEAESWHPFEARSTLRVEEERPENRRYTGRNFAALVTLLRVSPAGWRNDRNPTWRTAVRSGNMTGVRYPSSFAGAPRTDRITVLPRDIRIYTPYVSSVRRDARACESVSKHEIEPQA